jgi:hypothetical protein
MTIPVSKILLLHTEDEPITAITIVGAGTVEVTARVTMGAV